VPVVPFDPLVVPVAPVVTFVAWVPVPFAFAPP